MWLGVGAGLHGFAWIVIAGGSILAVALRTPLGVVVILGAIAGHMTMARIDHELMADVPTGTVTMRATVLADPVVSGDDVRFPVRPYELLDSNEWVRWEGPRLVVVADAAAGQVGDQVQVRGSLGAVETFWRGDPVAGIVSARTVDVLDRDAPVVLALGNALRERVRNGLVQWWPEARAVLIAGFLTGDVAALTPVDAEAMRRAGLSHFVAVSGSNVALFLAGLFLVLGPFAWGPRRRVIAALGGLVVFVVATRWEPSVVRAASMAAIVLGGRLVGVAFDAWTALGIAISLLLVVSPELAVDLGFQLSAAATAGVLAGAHVFDGRRPRWAWTALGASLAAQAAVAPILLVRLGTMPLAGPLVNPVAAPIVAAATMLGGVGTLAGIGPATAVAVRLADVVLWLAHQASVFPEVGWAGALAILGVAAVFVAAPRGRMPVIAILLVVGMVTFLPDGPPSGPEMVVLDVGQGDSILLRGPGGEVVLVDGGPDPTVLHAALRRRGVTRVDLMVATHRHADHTTGLAGIVARLDVGRLWHPGAPDAGEPLDELIRLVGEQGGIVEIPVAGTSLVVGAFGVEVLGPLRRYASPNDGSLVLMVRASGATALLSGDIETYAQADLGPLRADVMKVPHQGAATSDPRWLVESAPRIAVISVGPNDFGHPSDEVIGVLEGAGATVLRTDRDGDVTIRFDRIGPGDGAVPLPSQP